MSFLVSLSGHVGITADGGDPVDTAGLGRLGRTAFAFLVAERHRPVPRDELAEVLWGDELPRTWDTSLRVVVSKLRNWLESAGLDRTGSLTSALGSYQLHLPPGTVVDVEQAERDLEAAHASMSAGDAAARDLAAGAVRAATREFVPGGTGAWVERRRGELRDLRVGALEALADAHLVAGDAAAALSAAEEAARAEPLRESAHVRVMRAHAAAGNRGEALRAYERLRRTLAEELGVSPSPLTEAAYLALLQDDPAATVAPAEARQALPAGLSSFVGREAEVAEVVLLLRGRRLVTLVGTGGVGKTRLALEVARRVEHELPGGAALVELGDVSGPAAAAPAVLAAVGLAEEPSRSPLATLVGGLAGRRLLVVLDNCEHVAGGAAEVVQAVLAACPGVIVLATSREPLRLPGEAAWLVPPLSDQDAVQLFAERAALAGDPAAVADVCRRLDGIALAIELAASRTDVLSLPEIAERLDDRFRLLTGGSRTAPARQQTLRGAVDWSYDALPERERRLFQHVSVFAGRFTLAGAGHVGDDPDPLDALTGLVARSLVLVDRPAGTRAPTRYRLLETLRTYAAEKLTESGGRAAAEARLLEWAVDLAERSEAEIEGADQALWLDRLEGEHPNLRVALAVDRRHPDTLRLAAAMGRFWEVRGHLHEGRALLREVLAENDADVPLVRARAHNAAALLAQRQGDYAAARSRLEESLAIRRRLGDRLGEGAALHGLGNLAALQHDTVGARALYERALAIGRELGDASLVAAAVDNLGWVAHASADFPSATAYYEEALAIRRELGDDHGTALVVGQLGDLAYQQGHYGRAEALHDQSLELRTALGDRAGRADALSTLGHLAMHGGDLTTARERLEESLQIRRDLGDRAALPSALVSLGDLALVAGAPGEARGFLDKAAAAAGANRDPLALAHVLVHRGRLERVDGRPDEAAARYAAAKAAAGRLGAGPVTAEWLEGAGATVAATGDPARGARLLGAADRLRDEIGAVVPPHERPLRDRDVAAVRAALGESRFLAAWNAGKDLSLDAAIAEAAAATGAG